MPFDMIYTDEVSKIEVPVLVYDFIPVALNETYALCWNKKHQCWLTVSITLLTPVLRKDLNE